MKRFKRDRCIIKRLARSSVFLGRARFVPFLFIFDKRLKLAFNDCAKRQRRLRNCSIRRHCALNQIQHVHVKYYRPVLNRPTLGRLSSSKLSVQLSVHLSGRNNEVYSRRNGRGRELISAKSVQTHWFKR